MRAELIAEALTRQEEDRRRQSEVMDRLLKERAERNPFQELEHGGEYVVVKVIRDSTRDNPLIAAVIEPVRGFTQQKVLILDRPNLPAIKKGRQLYLTEFTHGNCKVYRETLPR
jgi:hypothetical protein